MSFGQMPIANNFLNESDKENEYFFEMAVGFCDNCKTFQLLENPEPEMMFNDTYAFFSGTSEYMKRHFKDFSEDLKQKYLQEIQDPFIVEIGCNDGIMINNFKELGFRHVGIEPSGNVADVAISRGINVLKSFFNAEITSSIEKDFGKADLITSANVICHIPDLNSVAENVSHLLSQNGVFVFEEPYLGAVIEKTSYDQIYDEHIYVFSAIGLRNSFSRHGLKLINLEPQLTHGGSMRYHFALEDSDHPISKNVEDVVNLELAQGLDKPETYEQFKENCEKSKSDLVKLLTKLKEQGKKVCGYAATSKSTTVLNYCDIDQELIEFISDTTPIKQGKLSPGKYIPIKKYEEFSAFDPDYAVLFAWNHEKEILAKEKDFSEKGGKWIKFVPTVHVNG